MTTSKRHLTCKQRIKIVRGLWLITSLLSASPNANPLSGPGPDSFNVARISVVDRTMMEPGIQNVASGALSAHFDVSNINSYRKLDSQDIEVNLISCLRLVTRQ